MGGRRYALGRSLIGSFWLLHFGDGSQRGAFVLFSRDEVNTNDCVYIWFSGILFSSPWDLTYQTAGASWSNNHTFGVHIDFLLHNKTVLLDKTAAS